MPSVTHRMPPTHEVTLRLAVTQLSRWGPLAALEPLRIYWAGTREPSAAELMSILGKAGSVDQPHFEGTPEGHKKWMKAARRFDATKVTPLLDGLSAATSGAEERLGLMLGWRPDPRVAEAMMTLLGEPLGARPLLWQHAYDLLLRNADPRFCDALERNASSLVNVNATPGSRSWVERQHANRTIDGYLAKCANRRRASADETALLAELATLSAHGSRTPERSSDC